MFSLRFWAKADHTLGNCGTRPIISLRQFKSTGVKAGHIETFHKTIKLLDEQSLFLFRYHYKSKTLSLLSYSLQVNSFILLLLLDFFHFIKGLFHIWNSGINHFDYLVSVASSGPSIISNASNILISLGRFCGTSCSTVVAPTACFKQSNSRRCVA